ncbi:GNAT family N-acetyltransferase [Gracilibacillus sp. YIM 98692]|uniref:GNAT family N-acetyltransferase n=1 Tax=Gracilibacillus sp. YIM 98692 TaxID=2663532 RepID=UPI0013D25F17|nr:GNAT family N-acetyltransferase [Gracilibacillus sp. YIM 98692]
MQLMRKARLSDVNKIAEMALENSLSQLSEEEKKNNGFLVSGYTKEQYQQYIKDCEHFYVVEKEGELQGFLLGFLDTELNNSKVNQAYKKHAASSFVVIKQICVAKNAQKQGVGKKLYRFFIDTVKQPIYLAVVMEPYNAGSVKFHEKLGFHLFAEITPEDDMKRALFCKN